MNNEEPKVSIILPVHNAGAFLPSCLQSLFSQTHQNLEIIAIDDNSTDDSYAILRAMRKLDPRLKISRNVKNYGMAITLNRCLKRAKGALIAFMDTHDKALVKRIEEQVTYLAQNPKIAAVGTQCTYIGQNNRKVAQSAFPVDHDTIYKKLLHGLSMQFETCMVHKERLPKDMLKFSVNVYPYIFADLFLKLSQYGQIANLSKFLHHSRAHKPVRHAKTLGKVSNSFYAIKMWAQSLSRYGDTPSLRSVVMPLLRT